MDPVIILAVAVLAALGGVVLGVFLRSMFASQTMKAATSSRRSSRKRSVASASASVSVGKPVKHIASAAMPAAAR